MRMERVAVVGAGLMGHGIAQVFAEAGAPVTIWDPNPEVRASVPDRVRANLRSLGRPRQAADQVVERITVHVRKDVPGFVGNRLQHALWREAFRLVEEGICDPETVDVVVKSSFGRRLGVLGPIENADLVGLDLTLAIHEYLLPHLDRTPGPAASLRDKVARGELGMKSGKGFRTWREGEPAAVRERLLRYLASQRDADGEAGPGR